MELLNQYIEKTKLVSHQIRSFNDLINNGIQKVIDKDSILETVHGVLRFGQVYVSHPSVQVSNVKTKKVYPIDTRNGQMTYEGHILVNIHTEDQTYNRVSIGKIPIMVGSQACNLSLQNKVDHYECPNDPGGYFIINGKEKVLVSNLRPVYNRVFVYPSTDKYKYVAEMRSMNSNGNTVLLQAKSNHKNELFFSLPYIKEHVPAGIVMKALGVSWSFLEENLMLPDEYIEQIHDGYLEYKTQKEAEAFLGRTLSDPEHITSILQKEIFCHLGFLEPVTIAIHLGYILKKLVDTILGIRCVDDKDNIGNKRLDTPYALVLFLFQSLWKQFTKNLQVQINLKKKPDYIGIIRTISSTITNKINSCFSTGTWDTQKNSSYVRVGVAQALARQNYGAFISHLRRITLPIGMKGKNTNMRKLHSSHFGYIDPYETPEGKQVGLVTNLAITSDVSLDIPIPDVLEVVTRFKSFHGTTEGGSTLIIINGIIIGRTSDQQAFVDEFNLHRDHDMLDKTISIIRLKHEYEIHIECDHGRFMRPLFTVKDNKKLYVSGTWDDAVDANHVVFRSPWELEQVTVAMDESDLLLNKCSYLEICPEVVIFGAMSGVIPFPNHSQSPRIAYQSCMGKQAIGIPSLAWQYRYDTTLHVLDTPQKPLTQCKLVNVIKYNEMSHGAVPIVAISTFGGFNQEDSVILNKASIERGIFQSTTYKTITEEAKKRGNSDYESICSPKYQYRRREYNYGLLDDNGIVRTTGIKVSKGDVIIGKTINKTVKKDDKRVIETVDSSTFIKANEEGYIDSIHNTVTSDGVHTVKVRIRIHRFPQVGDKFASSCAQKGTCGMIYSQEDMPFDKEGITPDLIINPHAIPSRMTINMLIEMCYNLLACERGCTYDATAFHHEDVIDDLQVKLMEDGRDSYSSELYCGFTGKKYPSRVFMAPAFYQRLKHMVSDKFHARKSGPLDTLTHQPVAGRSKDGGLRYGEMERDTGIVHGTTKFINETLYTKSDKYTIPVCVRCGTIPHSFVTCNECGGDVQVKILPYASKLLFQNYIAMGLKIRFK